MKNISIHVWKEMNEEQINIIKDNFKWNKNISFNIEKNIIRFSEWDLSRIIQIWIGVISSWIYDIIRLWIKKVLNSSKIWNNWSIIIKETNKQYIFTKDQVFMQSKEKEIIFKSIDDCFEYIKKENKK